MLRHMVQTKSRHMALRQVESQYISHVIKFYYVTLHHITSHYDLYTVHLQFSLHVLHVR